MNIYKYFLRPSKNLRLLGHWAVVTGATDGIGKAYAMRLASKGINIVLISRTDSKLQAVKSEIQAKYSNVEVKTVVCDYSNFDEAARKKVKSAVGELDIGVLVNNVGVSYEYPKRFSDLSSSEVSDLMEMNVSSTTWMTHMVLPGMLSRRRGAIVNLGSSAGVHTMPLLAAYSASKGYVAMLSRGLSSELSGTGVTVSCQTPFYVKSKLSKMRAGFTVPTPEAYAKMGLGWIGFEGDAVTNPFWVHGVMSWFLDAAPAAIVDKQVLSMHRAIQKRAEKKKAEATKKE